MLLQLFYSVRMVYIIIAPYDLRRLHEVLYFYHRQRRGSRTLKHLICVFSQVANLMIIIIVKNLDKYKVRLYNFDIA